MKQLIAFLFVFFLACNSKHDSNKKTSVVDSTVTHVKENSQSDSILISERVDGPANIRDTVNGKLLFSLNDNVPVTTTAAEHKWLK